jgi:hypothetical protein
MLNWKRQEQALTQGQPQGEHVVARTVHIEEMTSTVSNIPDAGPATPIDPHLVAQLVLELLRQDLRVERERRNLRR